jgi:hypothetical protein
MLGDFCRERVEGRWIWHGHGHGVVGRLEFRGIGMRFMNGRNLGEFLERRHEMAVASIETGGWSTMGRVPMVDKGK